MPCSRVNRRALSMEIAARATSSSASTTSSGSNGSGRSERQKLTTPRIRDPARTGTVISEWMPNSTTCSVRSRSWARQPGAWARRASRTARASPRLWACGAESTNRILSPTAYSGAPLRIALTAVRRSVPRAPGSSP